MSEPDEARIGQVGLGQGRHVCRCGHPAEHHLLNLAAGTLGRCVAGAVAAAANAPEVRCACRAFGATLASAQAARAEAIQAAGVAHDAGATDRPQAAQATKPEAAPVGSRRCARCGHACGLHDERGCPMLGCRCPLGRLPLDGLTELEARAAWGDR